MARNNLLMASIFLACSPAGMTYGATIGYRVDFQAEWSQQTHPNAYPAGAHWSPLIGGVHNNQASFWSPGGIASGGIELMAETGGTGLLSGEVQAAINAGRASAVIQGGGASSPGAASAMFEVSDAFPLVTLVSMVAPSPDWFVGVHDLDLRDATGWKSQVVVDLFAYDAGSDNGTMFTSADIDANPKAPIALLGAPLGTTLPRLGTFTFTRLTPVPELSGMALACVAFVGIACLRKGGAKR